MRIGILLALVCTGIFTLSAQDRTVGPLDKLNEDQDGLTLAVPALQPEQVVSNLQDGQWSLSVRLASPGADGLQFLLEDLRLPEGAQLSVIDASGNLIASYQSGGPLQGDAFWTVAVPGAEALLRVDFTGDAVSNLPFRITQLRHLNASGLERLSAPAVEEPLARPEWEGLRGHARFRGAVVPFEVRNGNAVFEGDIVLGSANEVERVSAKEAAAQRNSQGITGSYYRWTGGIVPYEIDPSLPNQYRITDAIAHWNTKLAGTITLRPRNGEAYYVRFVNTTSSGTCSSYIGNVHMAGQAVTLGSSCSTGNAIHEIGHAIGLFHEHTREDRNSFVRINTANITSSALSNFDQAISTSDDLGAYDYGSIMHYGAYSFSANGLPTIETIPAGIAIGQRDGLSAGDIAGVKTMYPAATQISPPSTITVTVGSNPTGQAILVDGVSITGPASFQWVSGTAHTLSAVNTASTGTRYVFKSWSDGGAQTHTVTTPTGNVTYTANYQKQFSLKTSSSNTSLGTVAASPASADSFYNDGTSVSVTAATNGSACLASWSGITAPPSTPVQVTVSQAYSVTGNFQSGSITAAPASFTFSKTGGTGAISVSSSGGCAWTAKSNVSWIKLSSGISGTSSGTVSFSVDKKNGNGSARTGTITIGNATVTIQQ